MRFATLISTVLNSHPSNWHAQDYSACFGLAEDLAWTTFEKLYVLVEDVDVSVAIGAELRASFREPWSERFPDKEARMVSVALRYRGHPVHAWAAAVVDGGRGLVVLPSLQEDGGYALRGDDLRAAMLFFELYPGGPKARSFDETMARTGIST